MARRTCCGNFLNSGWSKFYDFRHKAYSTESPARFQIGTNAFGVFLRSLMVVHIRMTNDCQTLGADSRHQNDSLIE
jgi:uncharacterized Fe-S cluster-containing radical SAM superfamily enzyme